MFEQKKYKQEIKRCRATIEEIERKRSRSQSALVQAILLQEEPNEADVEWFNKYTGEISACRNHKCRKSLMPIWLKSRIRKRRKNNQYQYMRERSGLLWQRTARIYRALQSL